ncbi:alternate-type signal peptide domain-containing protein [Mycetocola zhadangensis]|uniref:alternate-type signal peptide domain-containing protein n=1 Tax=Mycetocola zhadangensis TaxID=1164595 RepID=UPI003A4D501D
MKKFNMKKTTTAAVAATVGAVLLLGGAGTLAYWSDDAKTAQQTISSGELAIDDSSFGEWTLKSSPTDVAGKKFDGTIVPGDTVTTTVKVPVKLVGQNIKGELVVAKNAESTFDAANAAVAVTLGGIDATKGIVAGATADKLVFSKPFTGDIPVTVSVTFPAESKVDMNKALKVGLNYALTQK